MMRKTRKRALWLGILIGLVVLAGGTVALTKALGVRYYRVLTDSMKTSAWGSFGAGDLMLARGIDPANVRVGDVVAYAPGADPSIYLTHRVIDRLSSHEGVSGDWFVTKGDANEMADVPVRGLAILGKKLLVIPKLGGLMGFAEKNMALSCIFGAAALGLIAVIGIGISGAIRTLKSGSGKSARVS